MYCDKCGAQVQEGQNYCPSCGKSFVPASTSPGAAGIPGAATAAPGRLANHLRVLGILWVVYSVIHLLPSLGMFAFGTMWSPWMHRGIGWHGFFPGHLIAMAGGLFGVLAIIGIIAGWGLISRQPWARMLAIVLGCLALLSIPFGTALGIYTLWVLLPADSDREYRRLAGA